MPTPFSGGCACRAVRVRVYGGAADLRGRVTVGTVNAPPGAGTVPCFTCPKPRCASRRE